MPATTITQVGTTQTDSNDPAGAGGLTDTLVITKPSGTSDGHVMIAGLYMGTGDTVTPPSGWTQIGTNNDEAGTSNRTSVWYKVASSEGSSYTWTVTGTQIWGGCISTFSGVDTTSPIHQNAKTTTTSAGTNPVSGPNVTTTIESYIYTFQGTRLDDTVERSYSAPGTEEELADWGLDGGVTARQGAAYFRTAKASPGTIAGAAVTTSNTSNVTSRGLWTLALTPANPVDSDSGTGTESESGSITAPDSESGTGTETEEINIPITNTETGVGTEGTEGLVQTTEYLVHDDFDRPDETVLTISSSGHDWTAE